MHADPKDTCFSLMRFLAHTGDADKHDGVTSVHVAFVLLVIRGITEGTQRSHRSDPYLNESSLHESIGKSR